jgi:hypothetical protein
MLMFSRTATLTGSPRKSIPWAMAITDYVNTHGTLPVSCWSGTFGGPVGTVIWACRAESQAQLAAALTTLATDSGYLDLVEQAAEFITTPGQDALREVVYGTAGNAPLLGSVARVSTALAAVDRFADAVAWSVEIAVHIEGVTGVPVRVAVDKFGPMGGISWLSVVPDMAAADTADGKLAADPSYLGRLAATSGLFIPGSGHSSQAVRIA